MPPGLPRLPLLAPLAALLLAAGPGELSAFPDEPLLDDFDRPDQGPPPGPGWVNAASLPGQEGVVVRSNRAQGVDTENSHSASWNTLFHPDQEVYVRFADTPDPAAASGIGVRLQDPSEHLTPQYYTQWYARTGSGNDEVTIWKRFPDGQGNFQDACLACFVDLGTDLGPGDQIGLRAVGNVIEAFLDGVLVASATDENAPLLEPGYLNLYVGDAEGQVFDDFGGGSLVPACSDGLDNDGDGATDHPQDAGCADPEDDDEADASAGFPATPIVDDFERPDGGPPPGPGWVNAEGLAGPGVAVADGLAVAAAPADSNASSWSALLPAGQEVHVAYALTPGPDSSSGLSVRMQDPADHLSDQYYTQWYVRGGVDDDEVTIWKRFVDSGGVYRDACLACFVPLGLDLAAGDRIGMRASGTRIEAYLNGALVATVDDGAEPILAPGFVNLYLSDGSDDAFDDFGAGGLVPACADGLDNDADGAIDHPDDPECLGPDDDREAASDTDADGDGVADSFDNCLLEANPLQVDVDGDGCGNACDADYDQNGVVGVSDFNRMRDAFGSARGAPGYDPAVDFDADGAIGIPDFAFFRDRWGHPPGPSGTPSGAPSCP